MIGMESNIITGLGRLGLGIMLGVSASWQLYTHVYQTMDGEIDFNPAHLFNFITHQLIGKDLDLSSGSRINVILMYRITVLKECISL